MKIISNPDQSSFGKVMGAEVWLDCFQKRTQEKKLEAGNIDNIF